MENLDRIRESGALTGELQTGWKEGCSRPLNGMHADYIPNVLVQLHDGRKAFFYEDLLLGKTVLISCVSARHGADTRLLKTLVEVQSLLGNKLGKDVFIYCISTDPEHDTQGVLQKLSDQVGAKPGWLFVTGPLDALSLLRQRLFTHSGGHDCSTTLVRYGNESVGLWGGMPSAASAEAMMERLGWLQPQNIVTGQPMRKGPLPLADSSYRNEHHQHS